MAIVTILGIDYTAYSSLEDADIYFNASTYFADWDALTEDEKSRGLVSGTKQIDRQAWQGSKEDSDQTPAFPRTGLVDNNGSDETPEDSLANATEASLLFALMLANGEDVDTQSSTENLNQTLKAGSVMITNFRADIGTSTRYPLPIMELIGSYLSGSSGIAGSISFGTDGVAFNSDYGVNDGII